MITPEQAEHLRSAARGCTEALAEFAQHLRAAQRPDRPAWQSPYGPPRTRRKH